MRKIGICILVAVFLCGCVSAFKDVKIQRAMDSGELSIGDSMSKVSQTIGEPIFYCKKKQIREGVKYDIWDYSSGSCHESNWANSFILIFKDGYLYEINQL